MACSCGSLRTNRLERFDPTKTITIRKQFEADFVRRFKKLQRAIKTSIVDNKIFENVNRTNNNKVVLFDNEAIGAGSFVGLTNPQKVSRFMEWLNQEQATNGLALQRGTSVIGARNSAWMNIYIDSSYNSAIRQSAARMRSQGAKVSDDFITSAFNRPIHADTAGIIYTRAFTDLEGITKTMDQQISRILARGVIDGIGARELAKKLNDRVSKIGITRSRMLARTEVVAAHAEATLNMYEEAGLQGVTVQAEFTTAGDDSVCPECEALQGKIYTIEESRGVIPVHPNCRCSFLPVLDDPKSINLQ